MTQRKLIGIVVAVPSVLLAALLVWSMIQSGGNPGGFAVNASLGEVDVSAPAGASFEVPRLDGAGMISLSEMRGQVVMVDFWSSWCPPCRAESPDLEATYEDFKDQGVEFIGIAIWDQDNATRKFVDAFELSYPIAVDSRGAVAVDWGVAGLPEKFLIDRDGNIVKKFIGPINRDKLGMELREILDAGTPETASSE